MTCVIYPITIHYGNIIVLFTIYNQLINAITFVYIFLYLK